MIYIRRDTSGLISDIQFNPDADYEEIGLFDSELKAFLENSLNQELVKTVLEKVDLDMVRVIEDMIDLLIKKELILFTDLPLPVQNKLLFKRSLRQTISNEYEFIQEETLNF